MGSFTASEKTFMADLFICYAGFIALLICVMSGQIILGIALLSIICGGSIPISVIWYLVYSKKATEEISAIRFQGVTFYGIDKKPRHFEFGIKDYPPKEIVISDENLGNFEKMEQYKNAMDEVKKNEDIYKITSNEGYYVDPSLSNKYLEFGIETSEQIYCWEVINFLLIDSESQPFKKEENKKLLSDIMVRLKGFTNIGDKTKFLRELLKTYGGNKRLTEIYNEYVDRKFRIMEVERLSNKSIKVVRKRIAKMIFGLLISVFVTVLISLMMVNYKDSFNDVIITTISYFIGFCCCISIIIAIIIIYSIIKTENVQTAVQFKNMITSNIEENTLCYLKSKSNIFFLNPCIYKVSMIHSTVNLKEMTLITPDTWENSFDYYNGMKYHKGFPIMVQTTPITIQQIGSLFEESPICLTLCCSLYANVNNRILYNHKVHINWEKKIYLYVIGSQKIDNDTMVYNEGLLKSKINKLAGLIEEEGENERDVNELQNGAVTRQGKSSGNVQQKQNENRPNKFLEILQRSKEMKILITIFVGIIFSLVMILLSR